MSEQTKDVVMVPALPVDPETAVPLVYPVTLVDLGTPHDNDKDTLAKSGRITLELDSDERHLFECIRNACKALEEGTVEGFQKQKLKVRVAGGWVRDKVLGLQTHDVDIALDTCTGVEFANFLKQYMQENEREQIGRIGVIAANPAQSKHLETATMKVYGIEVDFCNLRHETYAEDSRIPTSMMGTPLEDAYRRDFTMNTLYYNLHSCEIEDWTRRGLDDLLGTKLVTTPLEAYQTFHDDPLRVMRAIRFAVRYGMELSDELQKACMASNIHKELHRKVSRERVGKELEGMLSGKHANPIQALKLICKLKLAGSVFCLPPDDIIIGKIGKAHLDTVPYQGNTEDEFGQLRAAAWEEAQECIRVLPSVLGVFQDKPTSAVTSFDSRLTYLSVAVLPYTQLMYEEKTKVKTVTEHMIREGIKFKNKDVLAMVTIFDQLSGMVQLMQRIPEVNQATRLEAGLLLREAKDMWVSVLVLATVALIRQQKDSIETSWLERARKWYATIVMDLKLELCWKVKPILNGKEMIDLLCLSKGPIVGEYAKEQTRWILMNPAGTADECKDHLKIFQKKRDHEQDQAALPMSKKMHL
jgi:tRNA nucleotidyltransferase (CCA-adding enzyme)